MKYICSLFLRLTSSFLGLTSSVCGMEYSVVAENETSKPLPLAERRHTKQILDVRQNMGSSYPTCLNVSVEDGYSLEETLKIRRSCLQYFTTCYLAEISLLKGFGLFKGELTSYNQDAMNIINRIFGNDGDKENQISIIPEHFRSHHDAFLKDLNDLKKLIQNAKIQPEPCKTILNEMRKDFLYVNWMVAYYSEHFDEYITHHR